MVEVDPSVLFIANLYTTFSCRSGSGPPGNGPPGNGPPGISAPQRPQQHIPVSTSFRFDTPTCHCKPCTAHSPVEAGAALPGTAFPVKPPHSAPVAHSRVNLFPLRHAKPPLQALYGTFSRRSGSGPPGQTASQRAQQHIPVFSPFRFDTPTRHCKPCTAHSPVEAGAALPATSSRQRPPGNGPPGETASQRPQQYIPVSTSFRFDTLNTTAGPCTAHSPVEAGAVLPAKPPHSAPSGIFPCQPLSASTRQPATASPIRYILLSKRERPSRQNRPTVPSVLHSRVNLFPLRHAHPPLQALYGTFSCRSGNGPPGNSPPGNSPPGNGPPGETTSLCPQWHIPGQPLSASTRQPATARPVHSPHWRELHQPSLTIRIRENFRVFIHCQETQASRLFPGPDAMPEGSAPGGVAEFSLKILKFAGFIESTNK